ncbi:MAG: hypothetical protein OXB93_00655 [Cytophagales bacterium]|nr:hypothetical protein [Cytophagales bacterium]
MSAKAEKDRLKIIRRKARIKSLLYQPIIRKVDVEEIKASFKKRKKKKPEKDVKE